MKKIIYAILGIFLMVACADDHLEELPTTPTEKTGEKVKVTFSVQIPEAKDASSRSFSAPAIKTLHLAVFDANGYLSEVVEAIRNQGATELGTAESPIPFEVELSQTPNKRIIHFLANKTIDANDFGTENELIGALYTTGEQDAYWQRIELNEGISFEYIDENETGSYDDGDELIRNTIGDQLTKVPLIRNFAKITVQKATNMTTAGSVKFELLGFTVVNVPDRGSVAPIKTNGGGFAQYLDASKAPCDYPTLTGTNGYTGFVPENMKLNTAVAAGDDFKPALTNDGNLVPFYLYERNNQTKSENRTFVIIKGKFGTEEVSYYKIDLTYKETKDNVTVTKNFEILRNFNYNIVIKNVESSGAESPEEAATMIGSHNNLSASIETQSLLNISDGAERLFVNYTEYVFVGTEETMQLKYRYVPNISAPNTVSNGIATYSWDKESDAVANITPIADAKDEGGWRALTVTAGTMDANGLVLDRTLTLVAGNLSRTIKFYLRPKYNFSNEYATLPQKELKAAFRYSFNIPQNIPESLFPLIFIVQASPENIYPNSKLNSLPVKVLDGEKTFGYEREVTYEEYQQTGGVINCYFRVNTENFAGTKITVSNRYFNDSAEVTLREGTKITVQESDGNNDRILTWNTTATSIANQTVTISLENSSVTWDYSLNNENFEVSRNGNQLTIRPKSIENDVQTDLTITTSDDSSVTIALNVVSYTTVVIPNNRISVQGQNLNNVYNNTWNIYIDNQYTQKIGDCNMNRTGYMFNYTYYLSGFTMNIPSGVEYLYFVYENNNSIYYGSMPVEQIISAQTNTGIVLNISSSNK